MRATLARILLESLGDPTASLSRVDVTAQWRPDGSRNDAQRSPVPKMSSTPRDSAERRTNRLSASVRVRLDVKPGEHRNRRPGGQRRPLTDQGRDSGNQGGRG